MKRIEWNGLAADYDEEEQAIMARLTRQIEAATGDVKEGLLRELRMIHESKALLDAKLTEHEGVREAKAVKDERRLGREQQSIFEEPAEVTQAREQAIERADRPPSAEWKEHAHEMIRRTARRCREFTSEDVWESGLQPPDEGSPDGDALGPAMRRAAAAGIMEATDKLDSSTKRPQRHNNPKRVWRSLVYEGA